MRKAIIAAIVATALFAVGAFAASFTLQAENVASETAAVDGCADKAVVNFTTSDDISTDVDPDDFLVTEIEVTFVTNDADNNPVVTCDDTKVDVAVDIGTSESAEWVDLTATTANGSTASFGNLESLSTKLPTKAVRQVSVLADGAPIATPTPAAAL